MDKSHSITAAKTLTVIEPIQGWHGISLRELWQYRDLLYFMVWRNIKVRYKQTILGVLWAILQPFTTMVVFSVFFGGLAKIPSNGLPYPVFSFTALVPWTYFSAGVTGIAGSIVGTGSMLKKIYFPRIIIPVSRLASAFIDFLLAFAVLLGMIVVYSIADADSNIHISLNILWLLPLLALGTITTLGVGLWLSALNVQFRDVAHATSFLVRLWMFVTPVIYPSSMLEKNWQILYSLNPMAGVIEGFRWALLGTDTPPDFMILVSVATALVLLVSGMMYFTRMEKMFADVV
ncbi:MAG: ABC transporter permease [Anaerolineae bacterium]|nr:ABC transporter permease [Anaerolineae bacterium]